MYKIIAFILLCGSALLSYADDFLIITDIHFNPFSECTSAVLPCSSLVQRIDTPIQDWPETFKDTNISNVKQDVNNKLLTLGLHTLKDTISKDKLTGIFVTGDLLSHNFSSMYATYAPLPMNNPDGLTTFSLKTMEYVLGQIHANFPQQPIYFTLGNNDSDEGDYLLPSPVFLRKIAVDLSNFIVKPAPQVKKTFTEGGFYSLSLNKNVTLIALNTNLLSQSNPNHSEANNQLRWLSSTLKKSEAEKRHVIFIQHIPFGVDSYKTATDNGAPVQLLDPKLQDQYLDLLQRYNDCITGIYAGHYHMDYFNLVNNAVPLIGTLGFSPIFGNNPGFKILSLSKQGRFAGYTTYVATLTPQNISWRPLYHFSEVYGDPAGFISTLRHFPKQFSSPEVAFYRRFFNGDQPAYPQPISNDKTWKYYYCGILNIDLSSYNHCLTTMGHLLSLVKISNGS